MTNALYLSSDETIAQAQVIACEQTEDGLWAVKLDRTIFHPQGGGQPSDLGTIGGVEIKKVIQTPDSILHFAIAPIHGEVELVVDPAIRTLHSRLHSAGHIIGLVGDELGWHATRGNHFPGESRVIFEPEKPENIQLIDKEAFEKMANEAAYVDIGLGMQLDENEQVVPSTAFNSAISGIGLLGFGTKDGTAEGVPNNMISAIAELGEIYSRADSETGALNPTDSERAEALFDNLQESNSDFRAAWTKLDTKAQFLKSNDTRLTSTGRSPFPASRRRTRSAPSTASTTPIPSREPRCLT